MIQELSIAVLFAGGILFVIFALIDYTVYEDDDSTSTTTQPLITSKN